VQPQADERDYTFACLKGEAAPDLSTIPKQYIFGRESGFQYPTLDQGDHPYCVWYSGAWTLGLQEWLPLHGVVPLDPLEEGMLAAVEQLDGYPRSNGASIRNWAKAANSLGLLATVNGEQRRLRVGTYVRVNSWQEACQAVYFNRLVHFGISVYSDIYDVTESNWTITKWTGGYLGGHAMSIFGYDIEQRLFYVQNSWGPGFGRGGVFGLGMDLVFEPADMAQEAWAYG
jgi:hypothetical protein